MVEITKLKKTNMKTPKVSGCRNPHEGESPIVTILRIFKEKKAKNKKPSASWKDKVIY